MNDGMPPWSRMLSSAIASSSPVVTPGRAAERSSSSVSPTSSPATRILSIWSRVLISRPRSRNPIETFAVSSCGNDVERVEDPLGDVLDLAEAVDLDEQAAAAVDLDQGRGLLGVDLLATTDHLGGVVGTALGLRALQEPVDDLVLVDGQHDHGVEGVTGVLDHAVELFDLREGAG